MKKTRLIISLIFCLASAFYADAQAHQHEHTASHKEPVVAPSFAWKLFSPLGLREPATIDTLMLNYSRQSVPSMVSSAYATTGNLGAEGMNMIFHERKSMSDFFFRDALEHWMPTYDKMRFYNTRIPMTLVSFNTAGGRENAQERLSATFSGNINAKAQVGAMVDYLYSKGSYNNQATKDLSWGLSGSYIGDRYQMQAYFNHFNLLNKENGGITDMLYITDPAEVQGGITKVDPKTIPTRLASAHTRLWGEELFVNNRYNVGFWKEEQNENDTTVTSTYVPVTSFIYTLSYKSAKHLFTDMNSSEIKDYFDNLYLNPEFTRDRTTYWTVTNTLGVSLLEGFNKYAKFGLAAYVTHQVRRYNQTPDTLDRSNPAYGLTPFPEGIGSIKSRTTQQLAWVGAQLTKQNGSILKYNATAEIGMLGEAAGEIKIDGIATTRFKVLGDSADIEVFGAFHNEQAPFLTKKYLSNHFIWDNDFGKQRTVSFGGELGWAKTGTHLRASLSNLQNHIYFAADGMPQQHSGSVQILSLSLKQNFRFKALNWDNSVTYQTTSNDRVIPLPTLAVYSNLYFIFKIATLHVQLGVDCDYYTKYYSPGYQPALAAFTNQRDMKVGNYPFCNAYINMKLSRARFYVLYSHMNKGLFGGNNYFSMPYYPLNPARFQMGISVDFAN